jgi:hypothetical protein
MHVTSEIYTGDDTVSYWNAYVAITQMHGHGQWWTTMCSTSVSS